MKNLPYDSQYSILREQIRVLGGNPDESKPDGCYEAQLEILELLRNGGGGGQGLKPPFEAKFNEEIGEYEMGIITRTPDEPTEGAYLWTYDDGESKSAGFNADGPNGYAYIQTDGDGGGVMSVGRSDGNSITILPRRIDLNTDTETVSITLESVEKWNKGGSSVVELTQAEYNALPESEKNNGTLYSITDAQIVTPLTKQDADTYYNPKNSVTASTSGYKFVKWNANGQITGTTSVAYQASQSINGSSRTLYSTSSSALPTIYAPTAAGTSGQYLKSNGSGAPVWANFPEMDSKTYIIDDAAVIAGTYTTDIAELYQKAMEKGVPANCYIKRITTGDAGEAWSFYLPSSTRLYAGNLEVWLFGTEDGITWTNIHYAITGEAVTRTETTGTFGGN